MTTVLLFDIDGTLISTGGAGRRSMELAFDAVHQRPDAFEGARFGGMTDRAIVRQGLARIAAAVTEEAITELIAKYLEYLAQEVPRIADEKYIVHAGMREAIEAGRKRGAAIGLGTGNVRDGARIKLQRVGLYDAFLFGGFGDDHELRPELIRRGAERGSAHLKIELAQARVIVIGDTPHDITAAHAIGARCLAVTTGGFAVEALTAAGADWVFADLESPGALDVLLDG